MNLTDSDIEYLCDLNDETIIPMQVIEPADWYESKKILMPAGAAIPGYVSYKNTPYWREPVNCISQYHPARDITIVGPAQDGKTFMVLEPMIGYTIECNPGNILHLTGNSDLAPDASLRVDTMIENCKLRYLIGPAIEKAVKNRTGDTSIRKEFPDGIYRVNSITKKNALRQNDISCLLIDDTDAAKKTDAKVGNLRDTAKGRTKAFEWRCKRVYTSSPESLENSFIWESWELSDKRLYYVKCPCCQEYITLQSTFVTDAGDVTAGLHWELDEHGRVDPKTVGYICQLCGEKFDERDKLKWMSPENGAEWRSTCTPKELYHYGYKKSALYASPGMTSWYTIAVGYVGCNPPGQPRLEAKWQTFLNVTMGEPYSPPTDQPLATDLMKNCRDYPIGVIPEAVSESDGNEDIVLVTCAMDCNGTLNDARIDYELKAYSRGGQPYSFKFGSLGTFIPNQSLEQKAANPRQKWTYEMNRENSVWRLVDELLSTDYITDTGRRMKIYITGIDAGHLTDNIFAYIDKTNFRIIGLMGEKEDDYVIETPGKKVFRKSDARPEKLFLLNVNMIKDDLSGRMRLKWDRKNDKGQPHLFMNYPQYEYETFFKQYESEEKKEVTIGRVTKFMWQKKGTTYQNHFWDVCVYHIGLIDILLDKLLKKATKDNYSWKTLVDAIPVRERKPQRTIIAAAK